MALRKRVLRGVLVGASAVAVALALIVGCGDNVGGWLGEHPPFTNMGAGLTGVESCSLAWGDYDNDGDLDLALAGATGSDPDYNPVSKVYRNDGGTFTDIGAGLTGVYEGSLAWGDYDSDGDLDLALAGSQSGGIYISKVYRNDGGAFTDIGVGLTGVSICSLAWGDYDNDGDLDLALAGRDGGSNEISKVYRNDGGTFTDTAAALTGVSACSLAWGDYDNDGDLDLALAGYDGSSISKVYRNDGGTFTDIGAGLTGVYWCSLAWGDYDSDGDLDLALAGTDGSTRMSKVYRNDGGTFTDTAAALTGVSACSLAWGDYDNDGDLDLALAGMAEQALVGNVYRNDGGTFTDIGAGLAWVYNGSLAWGDYDNDADLDLALAGLHYWDDSPSHISRAYRNDGGTSNSAPGAPTGLSAGGSGSDVTFSWDPAADTETPTDGLTYNLRVGTTPGADDVMPAHAVIGGPTDGRREMPAMGNVQQNTSWTLKGLAVGTYYWSVQAVDTGFAGSAWAVEQTVGVGAPTITTHPADQTVTEGETATFTVAATSSGLTYQWQVSTDAGSTWTDVAGETSDTYSFTAQLADDGNQYNCVVTNAVGSVESNAATLTVIPPPAPTITSPSTASGTAGVAFTYQITATNSPTSYDATGMPAGLSVNTSTGLMSGTPTASGTFSVTLGATNSGGTGTLTLTLTLTPAAGSIWYVVPGGAGVQDGASWADAFDDPQDAVNAASAGQEVWVAEGTYTNDNVGDGTTTVLVMVDGVGIYGGFAGTESLRTERDPAVHETILDGEDTAYHVVEGASNATLDGFTVTRGNADGVSWPEDYGAGMYNRDASPTVTNCVFSGNTASSQGGGMLNTDSSPAVADCTFSGNSTGGMGGGMHNDRSSPLVTNCVFSDNTSDSGGGAYSFDNSLPTFTDCIFSGNTATGNGGGMRNLSSTVATVTGCVFSGNRAGTSGGGMVNNGSTALVTACAFMGNSANSNGGGVYNRDASPVVVGCTFSGNTATSSGGGMHTQDSDLQVTNCTFSGNTAGSSGGGMCIWASSSSVTNCVVWGNSAGTGPEVNGTCTMTCSDVRGGYAGAGNIDADPMFVDPAAGILALKAGSPCIDSADGDQAPATDINGYARYDDPDTEPNTGVGAVSGVTWADMGAYEYQGAGVTLTVTSPNGGETWTRNQEYTVTWTPTGLGGDVRIEIGHMGTDPVAMPEGEWTGTTDTAGALCPSARYGHSAVWTGTRVILWGGSPDGASWHQTGAVYDPATDVWEAATDTGGSCPSRRYYHDAVWTGARMIVWGGHEGASTWVQTGGVYDLSRDVWESTTSTAGACPTSRYDHSAVWAGTRMIVWGGFDGDWADTGATYDPTLDVWDATTSTAGLCPTARNGHSAVWTGSRMIAWGGFRGSYTDTGAVYDVAADAWETPTSTAAGVPTARYRQSSVWTGTRMIVWGGYDGGANVETGGVYDPVADAWVAATSTAGACPLARQAHSAVWTGTRMIVWGGDTGSSTDTGTFYDPPGWHPLACLAESTPDDGSFTVTSEMTKDLWVGPEYRVRIVHLGSGAEDMSDADMMISAGGGPGVWHVNSHVTTSGDGSCWLEAMKDPQEAVDAASPGDEVWVQAGTYTNAYNGGGTNTVLVMKDGVDIYGGFSGWESQRTERVVGVRDSVLDGENAAYHVVVGASNATLDGFTVTRGNANGITPDGRGGGMYAEGVTNLAIKSCRFTNSTSTGGGGGGLFTFQVTGLVIAESSFVGNSSTNGGGLSCGQSTVVLNSSVIKNNSVSADGGGMLNFDSTSTVDNCVFSGNTAGSDAGGIDSQAVVLGTTTITNCSFSGNTTVGGGGAVRNTVNCTTVVRNCIMWGDAASSGQEVLMLGGTLTVAYSDVQGGYAGTGNIDLDPLFVDAAGGDFRLQVGSPSIDSADGDAAPAADILGNPRHDDPGVIDTGVGAVSGVTWADMGAYEFQGTTPFTDIGAGLQAVYSRSQSLAWGDYDDDGNLDLALTGQWYDPTLNMETHIYHNDGGGVFSEPVAGLPQLWRSSLAWGDCDADGDLDIVFCGEDYTELWRNDGGNTFVDAGASFPGIRAASMGWGDYDNDGDLDLAISGEDTAGTPSTKIYRNDGGAVFADISAALAQLKYSSLAWGDYDNDGDLDLAVFGYDATLVKFSRIYRNDGGDVFTDIGAALANMSSGELAWGDYDNDGDLDLAITGDTGSGYAAVIYRNDAGVFADIGASLTSGHYGSLAWGDYDNDGDLDLGILGYTGTTPDRATTIYRNDAGTFVEVASGLVGLAEGSLRWGDVDNDGDLDLAMMGVDKDGNYVGAVCRNNCATPNAPPAAPTGLSAVVNGSDVTFSWNVATDAETPQPGLTYSLRVGTGPGMDNVMPAMADLTTGSRWIPAMGNVQHNTSWTLKNLAGPYYWSVQAVDTAFAGSLWAVEETVTVP